jgi:hypothetical protein
MDIFNDIMSKVESIKSYDGGDTGLLNSYFPNWYSMDAVSRLPMGTMLRESYIGLRSERTDGYWKEVEKME